MPKLAFQKETQRKLTKTSWKKKKNASEVIETKANLPQKKKKNQHVAKS